MRKFKDDQVGFTLVELMVVMALIAVLSTLIIGAIRLASNTARETTHRSNAKSISTALEAKYAKYRAYCGGSTGVTCATNTSDIGTGSTADFVSSASLTGASILGIDIATTSECATANDGGAMVHVEANRYVIRPLDAACTVTIAPGAGTVATNPFDKNNDTRVGY